MHAVFAVPDHFAFPGISKLLSFDDVFLWAFCWRFIEKGEVTPLVPFPGLLSAVTPVLSPTSTYRLIGLKMTAHIATGNGHSNIIVLLITVSKSAI